VTRIDANLRKLLTLVAKRGQDRVDDEERAARGTVIVKDRYTGCCPDGSYSRRSVERILVVSVRTRGGHAKEKTREQ